MNIPIIRSMPGSGADRPDTVAPRDDVALATVAREEQRPRALYQRARRELVTPRELRGNAHTEILESPSFAAPLTRLADRGAVDPEGVGAEEKPPRRWRQKVTARARSLRADPGDVLRVWAGADPGEGGPLSLAPGPRRA